MLCERALASLQASTSGRAPAAAAPRAAVPRPALQWAASRARRRSDRPPARLAVAAAAAAPATVAAAAAAPPPSSQWPAARADGEVTPLALAARALELACAATRFGAALARARLAADGSDAAADASRPADALQGLLAELGPTFVKLAQTISMRPDLVGDAYAGAFVKLQDDVAPFPDAEAYTILERELGRPPAEVFAVLSPAPVASASLGQVYRGVLKDEFGGGAVAVKIQRPGVARSIAVDFRLLRAVVGAAQRALGVRRDLRALADSVGRELLAECNFYLEAANAGEFARAHAALPFLAVPRVYGALTTRRVLVSEWVDGRSPAQLLAARRAGEPGADTLTLAMVAMGIQSSLAQLLVTGVMHGDPHSGNLLLARDGRLTYLDFGLVVRVAPGDRQAMMAALVHLGLGEWARLVADLGALGMLREGTDRAALALDLEREFTAVLAGGDGDGGAGAGADANGNSTARSNGALAAQLPLLSLQSSSLGFGTLAAVLFRVAYRYRFNLPSYFPLVVRAVSSLEGVALAVDPGFKLVSAGMPVVLNQLLSDRRPTAQELLRELLLAPGGALRTDETTRQILQVWLSAAQQAARGGGAAAAAAAGGDAGALAAASPAGAALSMTSLLLDPRNVPLRRALIDVNPAATVAGMPRETRAQLLQVLTEAMAGGEAGRAGAALLARSPSARAQRRRLWMLFRNQAPKVFGSSPRSVLQLIAFSAAVALAIAAAVLRRAWGAAAGAVARLFSRGGGDAAAGGAPAPSPAA
jgi:predicted unusual protein kinase regulating ubiquinone biosynthesis (AarF/ABC1/UbiB family)